MNSKLKSLKGYVPPVFLAMLVASFILWYIAKLSYTYTTEQVIPVTVDGRKFKVTCVVEGIGTNLFGYKVYMNNSISIPLSKLKYAPVADGEGMIAIDPSSLQSAISVHYSDIKIIKIGVIPEILKPNIDD